MLYIYMTYRARSRLVPDEAVRTLERATRLAPYDLGFRLMVAQLQLDAGLKDAARANLRPVAYSPHGGKVVELAQTYLARMDADPKWDGRDLLEQRHSP